MSVLLGTRVTRRYSSTTRVRRWIDRSGVSLVKILSNPLIEYSTDCRQNAGQRSPPTLSIDHVVLVPPALQSRLSGHIPPTRTRETPGAKMEGGRHFRWPLFNDAAKQRREHMEHKKVEKNVRRPFQMSRRRPIRRVKKVTGAATSLFTRQQKWEAVSHSPGRNHRLGGGGIVNGMRYPVMADVLDSFTV